MARRLFSFMTLMADRWRWDSGCGCGSAFSDSGRWLMFKLIFVLGLIGYHIACPYAHVRMAARGADARFLSLRLFNEGALLLVVPIILLAVVKPF